ncbi:MAG: group II intron reverse transcriptase/maturase, partial [Ectobacillus sp.]
PLHKAYEWGNSRKGYWRLAGSVVLNKALGNSYWSRQGLRCLYLRYNELRHT